MKLFILRTAITAVALWVVTRLIPGITFDGPAGALLGVDFGLRTVGLAIGHHLTGSARPLEPLRYRSFDALLDGSFTRQAAALQ